MSPDQPTVSEFIVDKLVRLGVTHVFGYQGANITYIIDALSRHHDINYVQTYHEQAAAFAANGFAQSSGSIGVAVCSSGPGALNLITGVANAYCDSIPVLFICGDLSRRHKKGELLPRQDGFQSIDIVSISTPITKYSALVQSPEDIQYHLERGLQEALSGRKGPVLLSIPHWIQNAVINLQTPCIHQAEPVSATIDHDYLFIEIADRVSKCQRPIFLVGGGCSDHKILKHFQSFIQQTQIPVVSSLLGLNVLPHDDPYFIGFIGDYGQEYANVALAASDCVIALGSRMDERQVGFLGSSFSDKTIIHIDIDPSELAPPSERYYPFCVDLVSVLNSPSTFNFKQNVNWVRSIRQIKQGSSSETNFDKLTSSLFFLRLSQCLDYSAQIFVDVGLHQMCTAQDCSLTEKQKLYFSGGLGSMGYALPASIGGCLASPGVQTLCIVGDGGLMMSLSELQTISRDNLNIKIIIFNNECLGMVRNHQIAALGGRTFGTVEGYSAGNFPRLAAAFNIPIQSIKTAKETLRIKDFLSVDGPGILEVRFDQNMMPPVPRKDYSKHHDVIFLRTSE